MGSGAKKVPSRTGRPHAGQNSEISGIDAPQYPHTIAINTPVPSRSEFVLEGRVFRYAPGMWAPPGPSISPGLHKPARQVLLAAVFANAVNLEGMPRGHVVVLPPNLLFEFFHFIRKKLHRTAALGTYHVMMTAPVVLVFVASDAIVKGHFASQTALGQKLQGAVHRGVAD